MSEWADSQRHISTNRLYSVIHVGIRWKIGTEDKSNTDITKTKHNREKANNKTQQNKTILVHSLFAALGYETAWAYSTMLPSPHGAIQHSNLNFGQN